MYQVELAETALADLKDFSLEDVAEILSLLSTWKDDPKPPGARAVPMTEAADGMAYVYKTDKCTIFYNIFEAARVVKVVVIFRRLSLN